MWDDKWGDETQVNLLKKGVDDHDKWYSKINSWETSRDDSH